MELVAFIGVTGDEVVVLEDNEYSHLLPVRQIADSEVYESLTVPEWFTTFWHEEKTLMKCIGFTMHKLSTGWKIRWRDRNIGAVNSADKADYSLDGQMNCLPTERESVDEWVRKIAPPTKVHTEQAIHDEAKDLGNTQSGFHAWLNSVNESLPMPVPEGA